jgi:hypothetical protein
MPGLIENPRPFTLDEIKELEQRYLAEDWDGVRYHVPRMLSILRNLWKTQPDDPARR